MDLLKEGKTKESLGALFQGIKAIHTAANTEGGWAVARHVELVPADSVGLCDVQELEQARRSAALELRSQRPDQRSGKGSKPRGGNMGHGKGAPAGSWQGPQWGKSWAGGWGQAQSSRGSQYPKQEKRALPAP